MEKEIDTLPPRGYLLTRIGLVLFGALTLMWLPVEDTDPYAAQLLAAVLCLMAGLNAYFRRGSHPVGWLRVSVIGLLAGMAASPAAALLLIFKNGLHSHSGPDVPTPVLFSVVAQAPLWGLGGGLIAAGLHQLRTRK